MTLPLSVPAVKLPVAQRQSGLIVPAISLCERELVRFVRQPNRIVGALATPVVFWLLIGGGMGHSFHAPNSPGGGTYMEYFFPGTILMILLFTAVFSTISIIEDRREGFLQSVLVAPISRLAIVLGKVLGGTLLAFAQGMLFLLLSPLVGVRLSVAGLAVAALVMFIVAFGLTSLGLCIAWRMSSTQGFHAIMNLFLMPLWFCSGALFPAEGAWKGLRWVMGLNPLSYGLAGLRDAIYFAAAGGSHWPGLVGNIAVSVLFAATMFLLAGAVVRGHVAADLQ